MIDYVNRGNVSNTYDPNVNEVDEDEDEEEQPEDKNLSKKKKKKKKKGAEGVEETKGDETTGAGKYYYPKRFL